MTQQCDTAVGDMKGGEGSRFGEQAHALLGKKAATRAAALSSSPGTVQRCHTPSPTPQMPLPSGCPMAAPGGRRRSRHVWDRVHHERQSKGFGPRRARPEAYFSHAQTHWLRWHFPMPSHASHVHMRTRTRMRTQTVHNAPPQPHARVHSSAFTPHPHLRAIQQQRATPHRT